MNPQTNIKSISQIHKQLIEKKNQIYKYIQQISIPTLPTYKDFQTKNITIDKIFNQIPSQDRLKSILENIDSKRKILQNYHGQYQIIKKAASRVDTIKPQAKQIYQLFTELNLPKVKQNFKINKQKGLIKLNSFQIQNKQTFTKSQKYLQQKYQENPVYNQAYSSTSKSQSIKANKLQRNTISQDYLYSVKQSQKYEQILPSNQYLKDDQLLVHACIYDSLNGQKQHQFIFLGDMKLIDLRNQIYCKIQKLSNQENNKNTNKNNNMNKNQQKSFFLFEQNIYYQGTHHSQQQIDSLIKNIKVSYQTDFFKYSMNQTQIKNLRIVFGRPYLYRHMNGCDHMIVFKDIRLYDKNGIDPDIRKKYPFMIFQSKMKKRKCQGCDHSFAVFACVGDKLKNGQTSYLCKQCHQNIHNDITNPKNKFMKVIPYLHQ